MSDKEKKILVELTYEELKTLEMLVEVIGYVSQHGSLPQVDEIQAAKGYSMFPTQGIDESELKAHQKVGLAELDKLREKLRKAVSSLIE